MLPAPPISRPARGAGRQPGRRGTRPSLPRTRTSRTGRRKLACLDDLLAATSERAEASLLFTGYVSMAHPAVEDQATDRAHRIGRRETVHVHHLIAENTVEDHIGELLRRKRAIAGRLLTGDETSLTELTDEELGQLVSLGTGRTP
ncbi:MAG: hypothetical protein ACRDPY_09820 [Streptosporangiaceae bacterium]